MSNPLRPSREIMLAAEMMRVLGAFAIQGYPVTRPKRAAWEIRAQGADFSGCSIHDADWPELQRRAERIAMTMFFSIWYGAMLEAIEMETGELIYRVEAGHCGDELCCGPAPLARIARRSF